jgi:predicted DNA binding CopG/RHH family protein
MNVPKRKSLKPIPRFASEDEEREFWATHDSTEHLEWSRAQRATFSSLKPSTQTISLRLPELLVENLKLLANKRDVPYQSLLKVFLAERVQKELLALEGSERAVSGRRAELRKRGKGTIRSQARSKDL